MGATPPLDDLWARLRRLEDLEAIRQLFVDYGMHLDHCDFHAYAALFAAEGELLLGPMGRARGPQAIEAMMSRALGGRRGTSYHLIANPLVSLGDGADPDRASAEVTWAAIVRDPATGGPSLTLYGHHRDVLVREDGRWKFLRREGHVDLPARMPPG